MIVRTARALGLLVRERRRELGLNQAELAARAGVGRQWIVGIERGKPRAQIELLLATLQVLGLDVSVSARADVPTDLDRIIDEASGGQW